MLANKCVVSEISRKVWGDCHKYNIYRVSSAAKI